MRTNRWLPARTHKPGFTRFAGALAALGLLLYGCSDEDATSVTPPIEPAFVTGDGVGWDLNQNNTPTVVSPFTLAVKSSYGDDGLWTFPTPFKVGTGLLNPFLRVQSNGSEEGFNTSNGAPYDDKAGTVALPLNHVPIIKKGGVGYREFILDANENNSGTEWQISIDIFDVWVCNNNNANMYTTFAQFENNPSFCKKVYDLGGKIGFGTDNLTSGSGKTLDYDILIPEVAFTRQFPNIETICPYQGVGALPCGYWLIVRTKMGAFGNGWETDATFEEFSTIKRPYITPSKDAHTALTRTHQWTIEKSVDIPSWQFLPGQKGTSTYTVKVTKTGFTDSNWSVSGTVTILNPSTDAIQIESVTDMITGGGGADIPVLLQAPCTTISSGNPYTLAAGATLSCNYGPVALPNANTRLNTVTVALVDLGVNTATAAIDFSDPAITEVNGTINVVDKFEDQSQVSLGSASATKTFPTFTREFSCDDVPKKDNTATIVETSQSATATVTITCGSLTVTKDAATSLKRTFNWTIEKSVSPDKWDLFTGDDGTSDYAVKVTKTGHTDSEWKVTGNIKVHNPSAFAISVASVADTISNGIDATVSCGVSFPYSLAAGADLNCTYSASLPDGTTRTNKATAKVNSTNSFSGTASVDFGAAVVTSVNETVNVVDDKEGSLGSSSAAEGASDTFTYSHKFVCDADKGTYTNTAKIVETGQTASASVVVNCYQLVVTKDAATTFERTWDWTIKKGIDTSCFLTGTYDADSNTATILLAEALRVCYIATIDATSADSKHQVTGNIKVHNNHPSKAATLTQVLDAMGPINAAVTCPASTVAAGGDLFCTYKADLPDATSRLNKATATQQNHSYDSQGGPTPSGTSDYSGTANVSFSSTPTTETDECVDVDDLLQNAGVDVGSKDFGTYCANQPLPKEFKYYYDFGPNDIPVACGENRFDNTVTLVTNDTGTEKSADASVNIFVECDIGCTLTQGYWKTHNTSFSGGASKKADPTWQLLGDVDGDLSSEAQLETFFLSNQTWFDVFWTNPKGNPYYILAVQYMAAVLNGLAGADQSSITTELAAAKTLFETYTPAQVAALKNSPADKLIKQQFIDLATKLDDYNNGLVGPEHCTENVAF